MNQITKSPCRLIEWIKDNWNPKKIDPPIVDQELPNLGGVQRSAESLRYITLKTEHWLSPNGRLREWVRHHMLLSAILAVPAFLVLPIVGFILWQILQWVIMLTLMVGHMIIFPILGLMALLTILGVIKAIKSLFS